MQADARDTVSKRQKRESSKARIMEAALAFFMQKGFRQCTVEEIAANAELSPATVYYYFGTKENMAMAIGAHYLNDLTRHEMAIVECDGSVRECLYRLIRHSFDWMQANPLAARFLNSPDFFALVDSVGLPEPCHVPGEAVERLIERGQVSGEIRELPVPLLMWAMRIPLDVVLSADRDDASSRMSPPVLEIAEMIWRAIRSDAAALRDLGCNLSSSQRKKGGEPARDEVLVMPTTS